MASNRTVTPHDTKKNSRAIRDTLDQKVIPHLTVEDVYTYPDHAWKERSSAKYKGCCPWHESKSGTSFVVDPVSLQWYCAGCQVGGGPIQYLHKLRGGTGISPSGDEYVSLVRKLFQLANVPFPDSGVEPEQARRLKRLDARRAALAALFEYAKHNLWLLPGEPAREYLHQRGLNDEDIKRFGLGFYASCTNARNAVEKSGCVKEAIRDACVAWRKAEGYIIVPWNDECGRPLTAYGIYPDRTKTPPGGRPHKLAWPNPKDERGVLLHTKRSPLFLDLVRRAQLTEVVIVEGVIDALVLHARGDDRVVASAAAQLSRDQARTLKTCGVRRATVCLDPDSAGETGTHSCLRSLSDLEIAAFVAPRLPSELDPDDFVIKHGIDGWRQHIARAVPGTVYQAEQLLNDVTLDGTPADRRDAATRVLDFVATLDQERFALDVDDILNLVVSRLGYKRVALTKMMNHASQSRVTEACPTASYESTTSGIVWLKARPGGVSRVSLTNFNAEITADIIRDDGSGEPRRELEIVATVTGEPRQKFCISAAYFHTMTWVIEQLGSGAILFPGPSNRDNARTAIQLLSPSKSTRTVYEHTGWTQIENNWYYLHSGGALGPVGSHRDIEIDLGGELHRFEFPEPPSGDSLRNAVRASLAILAVAPPSVMIPVLAAAYRSVLPFCSVSVHLSGQTGAGKSEIAALAQQHFGCEMNARALPASWSSTDNAIEALAFKAKNALLVVDDFAPNGSAQDVSRLHSKADRIIRAQGNRSGRQRLRADSSLRPTNYPRGLLLSTGEDVPRGHSIRARMLVVEVDNGCVDWEALSRCQVDAAKGILATSMAGFIQWIANQYDDMKRKLISEKAVLREEAARALAGQHRRTPEVMADLFIGLQYLARFTQSVGVETNRLEEQAWDTLLAAASTQQAHQDAADPVQRFLQLTVSGLGSGACHIAAIDGTPPDEPQAWGWRRNGTSAGTAWTPQGARIGWTNDQDAYLDPHASYKVAQTMTSMSDPLPVSIETLNKRLNERNLLVSKSPGRLTRRMTLESQRRYVLHLRTATLCTVVSQLDQPGQPPSQEREEVTAGSELRPSGCETQPGVRCTTKPTHADVGPREPASLADATWYQDSTSSGAQASTDGKRKPECRADLSASGEAELIPLTTQPNITADSDTLPATGHLSKDCRQGVSVDPLNPEAVTNLAKIAR